MNGEHFEDSKEFRSQSGNEIEDKKLLEPCNYMLQLPDKHIYKTVIHGFNYWLKVPAEKLSVIEDVTRMIYSASLLIDDIGDDSKMRKGVPVAHSVYSLASTINSANYLMFIALEKVNTLKTEAKDVYTKQLLELHQGQAMEIYWRDHFICPTREEYEKMAIKKVGGLFTLAISLMKLYSEKHQKDYTKLIRLMSCYFQIQQDLDNLIGIQDPENEGYCEYLSQGKFLFPIVHAFQNKKCHWEQIMRILRQKTRNVEVTRYCVKLLRECESLLDTGKVLSDLKVQIIDEINYLGSNPLLQKVFENDEQLVF